MDPERSRRGNPGSSAKNSFTVRRAGTQHFRAALQCASSATPSKLHLSFGSTGAHEKKKVRYQEAIDGYKHYLKADTPAWFKPHHAEWKFEDLVVRINPQVGFVLGGKPLLVKLYFKQEPLTKHRVQVALSLMSAGQKSKKHCVAMLDVIRSKLNIEPAQNPQMDAFLKG